jgi:predicted AAA+ superfamily ATPase
VLALALRRASEPRRFIQVLAGPRQVGKTTIARQVMAAIELPTHYASADDPAQEDFTTHQLERFQQAADIFDDRGFARPTAPMPGDGPTGRNFSCR